MTCDNIRDFFAEAHYGELDERKKLEFDHHIGSCDSCAAEFQALKRTLALMDERIRPEPTGEEWREFSRRLDARLGRERIAQPESTGRPETRNGSRSAPAPVPVIRLVRTHRPLVPAWAYGIAALLLVVVGIYMGRTLFNGTGPELAGIGDGATGELATSSPQSGSPDTGAGTPAVRTPADSGPLTAESKPQTGAPTRLPGGRSTSPDPASGARESSATHPAADSTDRLALAYLERSRNLLLGLTNMDEAQSTTVDFTHRQEVSRTLYDQGNVLTVALDRPSQQQLRQLVQHLQIILLQLSNMSVGDGTPAVELVRQGVDSKSILLKINLEAIRATLGEAQAGGAAHEPRKNL